MRGFHATIQVSAAPNVFDLNAWFPNRPLSTADVVDNERKKLISSCFMLARSDHELLDSARQEETFLFSLRVIYSFLTFLGTCIAAAQVSENASRPLPILHTLTLRSSRLDMNTKMEAHFFLSRYLLQNDL